MHNVQWIDDDTEEQENENRASIPVNAEGDCLHIRVTHPYGHLKVFTDTGPVPKELSGAWTDLTMAKAAVESYVNTKVSRAKFRPKGEKAQVKKSFLDKDGNIIQ
jgi:hypothetical protein